MLISMGAPAFADSQSVEIIVNPALERVPLNRSLLRAIFTMQLRAWPSGPPVRVFVLPDNNPLSDRFYREQLGIYSYMLRAAWDRMVFTGTGLAPTVVQSEQEMRERVLSTPGAIGYVSKAAAAGAYLSELPQLSATATASPQSSLIGFSEP
jgi:ABC-type phosphate transport system substrate-binding protein